jgi:hypothetical protein
VKYLRDLQELTARYSPLGRDIKDEEVPRANFVQLFLDLDYPFNRLLTILIVGPVRDSFSLNISAATWLRRETVDEKGSGSCDLPYVVRTNPSDFAATAP